MKKTLPDGSVIEGHPDEIAQYEALVRFHMAPSGGDKVKHSPTAVDWEFVGADVGFRLLTRIKLAPKMTAILVDLHKKGEEWTSAKTLQSLVGYEPAQFAGLMGAFGRRVANTPGYVRGSSFFDYNWNDEENCYFYRLPPSSREAIEKARLI
jgi:hypothetical protein